MRAGWLARSKNHDKGHGLQDFSRPLGMNERFPSRSAASTVSSSTTPTTPTTPPKVFPKVPPLDLSSGSPTSERSHPILEGTQGARPRVQFTKPQEGQVEEFDSPRLDTLNESVNALKGEVYRMSRNLRSVIHGELEASLKALCAEMEQMMVYSVRNTLQAEMTQFFEKLVLEPMDPNSVSTGSPTALRQTRRTSSRLAVSNRRSDRVEENSREQQNDRQEKKPLNRKLSRAATRLGLPGQHDDSLDKRFKSVSSPEMSSSLEEPLLARSSGPEEILLTDAEDEDAFGQPSSFIREESGSSKESQHSNAARVGGLLNDERALIKKRLKEAVEAPYNVEDYYWETGFWQAQARQDSWFAFISLMVVAANVIWIGVDEDLNQADVLCNAPMPSQIVNNIFCVYFTVEMVVRFMAFKVKCNAFRDTMFVFDLVLVTLMIWETWIEVALYLNSVFSAKSTSSTGTQVFRFFRLFRLTRVPRIIRLSRSLPELMILMKGMGAAMRSVMIIMLFIGITIFVFGILFTELLRDTDPFQSDFGSVPQSMHTLLLQVLCGADADFIDQLKQASWVYYVLYLVFLFVAILTWMNMMIGVLCDVVSGVADDEEEYQTLLHLEHEIGRIAHRVDLDGSGTICQSEFDDLMKCTETLQTLDGIGVDVVALACLSDFIFANDEELTLGDFCHLVTQFQCSRHATVKDLLNTQRFITMELDSAFVNFQNMMAMALDKPDLERRNSLH